MQVRQFSTVTSTQEHTGNDKEKSLRRNVTCQLRDIAILPMALAQYTVIDSQCICISVSMQWDIYTYYAPLPAAP